MKPSPDTFFTYLDSLEGLGVGFAVVEQFVTKDACDHLRLVSSVPSVSLSPMIIFENESGQTSYAAVFPLEFLSYQFLAGHHANDRDDWTMFWVRIDTQCIPDSKVVNGVVDPQFTLEFRR
jgi:hypothetical protein